MTNERDRQIARLAAWKKAALGAAAIASFGVAAGIGLESQATAAPASSASTPTSADDSGTSTYQQTQPSYSSNNSYVAQAPTQSRVMTRTRGS